MRLRIVGPPRTKKTHNQLVMTGGRHRVLPSRAWQEWCKTAGILVVTDTCVLPFVGRGLHEGEFNCRAYFYRDARRGDAVGYYQGLADLLEKRGVLGNDRQIVSWDGSRLLVDRTNPRVEVVLEEVA